jgi:hypothetical protein
MRRLPQGTPASVPGTPSTSASVRIGWVEARKSGTLLIGSASAGSTAYGVQGDSPNRKRVPPSTACVDDHSMTVVQVDLGYRSKGVTRDAP